MTREIKQLYYVQSVNCGYLVKLQRVVDMVKRVLFSIFVLFFLFSCKGRNVGEIKREKLFSLEFGKLENQIDLFQFTGRVFNSKNRIFMRNGIFYISNGNANKIMEFSSYGDLIFLLYNPRINPEPFILKKEPNNGVKTTKYAVPINLSGVGDIVVNGKGDIYVENMVDQDRAIKDKKKGIVLNRVVSHFRKDGTFVNFLGQEGVGGTPFPFIEGIFLTDNDEPVVVTRTPKKWEIFWFYSSGDLRYHVILDDSSFVRKTEKDTKYEIEKIVPDYNSPDLYVAVSSYEDIIDPSTHVRSGIKREGSGMYDFNLVKEKINLLFEVPKSGTVKENIGGKIINIPAPSYEFFGVTEDKIFFFLKYNDLNRYTLLTLDSNGSVIEKRIIVLEDSQLAFEYLRLSPRGIIYGLIADNKSANVVWWRSDKILEKYRERENAKRRKTE